MTLWSLVNLAKQDCDNSVKSYTLNLSCILLSDYLSRILNLNNFPSQKVFSNSPVFKALCYPTNLTSQPYLLVFPNRDPQFGSDCTFKQILHTLSPHICSQDSPHTGSSFLCPLPYLISIHPSGSNYSFTFS